jgi:hypothetical protein
MHVNHRKFTFKYSLRSIYISEFLPFHASFSPQNINGGLLGSPPAAAVMCTTIHQTYLYCDCFLTKIIYCRGSKTPSRKIQTSKEKTPTPATATPVPEKTNAQEKTEKKTDEPQQQRCDMKERLSQFPFSCGKEECPRVFTTCRWEC